VIQEPNWAVIFSRSVSDSLVLLWVCPNSCIGLPCMLVLALTGKSRRIVDSVSSGYLLLRSGFSKRRHRTGTYSIFLGIEIEVILLDWRGSRDNWNARFIDSQWNEYVAGL
jgi:hypothetical protein